MNIMFLIFSFNIGGIERLLIDMSEELANRGNSVSLCIINKDYDDNLIKKVNKDVDIIKLNRGVASKGIIKYMFRLAFEVKRKKVDVLHCQGINCVIFSYLAKMICPRTVILNTVHDVGNYPSYSKLKLFTQNLILDKTIAISKTVEKEILSRNQDAAKVCTIYNSIDLKKFTISSSKIKHPFIRLGNVARFYPAKKGQDVLVDALDILHKQGINNVICKFAGDVFKGQEYEYKKVKELVEQKKLSGMIKFCGGIDNVPEFLSDVDVFVMPSIYEGFGIALIEALAMGIPVVASNIDGPKEIFELAEKEGVDIGYLAQKGDAQDLSIKIWNCIEKCAYYNKDNIRDFVERHFSIEHMIDEHMRVYNILLKGNNNKNDN